jgi:hypothetical protein
MKLPQPHPNFSNYHPDQSAAINIEARPSVKTLRLAESSDDG